MLTCPACSFPIDIDEDRTFLRCLNCGHITDNPFFGDDFDEDAAEWDDMPNVWVKPGPFASLRGMVYTECPCGCGSKEICDAQRARVKAHNNAIPF
jgi:hypothetical protein